MTATPQAELCRELAGLLPADALRLQADDMAPYLRDQRQQYLGAALAVIRPDRLDQVSTLLRWCHERRVGVVPQGGNTGYCGGATPDRSGRQVVLSLQRLRRIRLLDAANFSMTVDAGCVLSDVQAAALAAERYFPLRLGSEGSCQIGGNLATNAGGLNVLRYGMMRDLTLGVEVVLPDGRVLDGLRCLRKDNTGYDLKSLFIGSEGTLGVITAACLKLWPRPRSIAAAWVVLPSVSAAVELLSLLREHASETLSSFELLPRNALQLVARQLPQLRLPLGTEGDWQALIELSSPAALAMEGPLTAVLALAAQRALIGDTALATSEPQRSQFWQLRESVPEAQRRAGPSLKHDVSVPIAALPAFLQEATDYVSKAVPEGLLIAYGHAGDGSLHVNISRVDGKDSGNFLARRNEVACVIHDLAMQHGGSISAEHGIGQSKVAELARTAGAGKLAALHAVKLALDPNGIMNPGKLLP